MLRIEVNKETYNVCQSWNDLTLNKMAELCSFITSSPEWISDFHTKPEDVTLDPDQSLVYEIFIKKVTGILSDIPLNIIYAIDKSELESIYLLCLKRFVLGCLNYPDYDVKGIDKFSFHGINFYLPTCDKDIAGNLMPCVNTSALELCESTDLKNASDQMNGGNFYFASNVISILCRPRNEKYNENICKERAKLFADLTMDIVLEVFFCLEQLTTISSQNIQICILREDLVKKVAII